MKTASHFCRNPRRCVCVCVCVCVENVSPQKEIAFSESSNNEFFIEYNKNLPIKISTFNPPAADGGHTICYAFDSNTRVCCCEC